MNAALENMPPITRRVRAYFAPVDRATGTPTMFDASRDGAFDLDAAPAPWVDLGWIDGFSRECGSKVAALHAGTPSATRMQARTAIDAAVSFRFQSWGKLQLALSAGAQQMNALPSPGAAVPLLAGATATALPVGSIAAAGFAPGDLVSVDVDYAGETGWVGAGVSGAFLRQPVNDVNYVRRVSLNVVRVLAVQDGVLQLDGVLLAGTPPAAMKVSRVTALCDREGSSFFQEWSGLFVAEGQQGERVVWHYPRLQTAAGAAEHVSDAAGGLKASTLRGVFRALPVVDPLDGETVVCFRSYVRA